MRIIKSDWISLIVVILICCNLSTVELKRSFGIGRSRGKVSNPNVRRRGHIPSGSQNSAPAPAPAPASSHKVSHAASESASKPVGPPPPYSAVPNAKNVPPAAPPAYSPSHVGPPSYSATMGHSNPSSNLNYPRQSSGTYSGVNSGSGSGPYNSHPNYGANTGAGFSHTPYHSGYGGAGYNGYNGMNAAPGFSGGYGSYGGGYGGGFGGGFGGGMGPMGGYGYQKSPSMFSAGNLLTGLAVWQLARGLGGSYGHHDRVYHVYNNSPQQAAPVAGTVPQSTNVQDAVTHAPIYTDAAYAANAANVPFPAEVTPVPDANYQYEFATIHPSLFPYGRADESLLYWANTHAKTINITADATDSIITTTTPIPN